MRRRTSPDALAIGQRIRRLRLNLGLSQKELAEKAGVHPNNVYAWEKGEQNPGLRTRQKLAAALCVQPEVLFYAGQERGVVLSDVATDTMVRVARNAEASPTQLLSAARGLLPKPSKHGDAAEQLAQFRRMMEAADAKFRRLVAEIQAEQNAEQENAAPEEST